MTHLYLIRHGQAMVAVQEALEDTGLSPLGVKQTERLRDRLAATGEIAADVLIASTMLRARQTAEILAPAFGLPIVFDDEVQEWREGEVKDLQKINIEEYRARFNAVPFDQKPFFRTVSSSETWVEFMLRAATALNRITHEYEGKTIVIVCHGGIVDCSMISFFGMSSLQFSLAYFNTHNTSITHWYRDAPEGFPVSWVLERYNDVMHLRDIDSPIRIPWKEIATRPVVGDEGSKAPTEAE
jgi:2,3-bisphosphoglycerate-dependent phosphoglycerate mutase